MFKPVSGQKSPLISSQKVGITAPLRFEYVLFAVGAVFCMLSFAHPDILETARHSYILIRSTLDGDFLGFFENTLSRKYGYAYVNAAHYNILAYLLYAVWELPLYLLERLLGLAPGGFAFSDSALALWCKPVSIGFYLGCGMLLRRLAVATGCDEACSSWAPLLFWLNPIGFFTVVVMGQYDSICLFFLLLALVYYFKNDLWRFSLVMGVGFVFKFFPLFVFLPLLLLVEKRILHLAKYALCSLWLYLPTSLLFAGRTGDASFFNSLMTDRLFANVFAGGLGAASRFGLCMALLCVAAWLYRPANTAAWHSAALYAGLAAFCALFAFVFWHPQWLILLVPFLLLTTLRGQDRTVFAFTETILCIGFFLLMAAAFPRALEANLLDFGIFRHLGLSYSAAEAARLNSFYFGLIPYLNELAPIMFHGAILCEAVFKLPLGAHLLQLAQNLRPAVKRRNFCMDAALFSQNSSNICAVQKKGLTFYFSFGTI